MTVAKLVEGFRQPGRKPGHAVACFAEIDLVLVIVGGDVIELMTDRFVGGPGCREIRKSLVDRRGCCDSLPCKIIDLSLTKICFSDTPVILSRSQPFQCGR